MKKILSGLLVFFIFLSSGCSKKEEYQLYSKNFFGPFDTATTYMTYAKSEEEFKKQCDYILEQLEYYDQLFDKYTSYEGIANIKTINDAAGKTAVKVEQPILDLLSISIERYHTLSSNVNTAFGSVLNIWHAYRERAEANEGIGEVPSLDELQTANLHTNVDSIHLDQENKTVYIDDANVSIDVGATAKGYAVELIKDGLIEMGVDNFLLSGGGNVATHGERKNIKQGNFYLNECREKFCVGIQSPRDGAYEHEIDDPNYEDEIVIVVEGESIVTSGDYQRYFEDEEGNRYNHLIRPDTLYPANYFRSVSIITEDSGLADFLSSAVFLMDFETGMNFVNSLDEVEAIWLLEDGKIRMSDGLKDGDSIYVIDKTRLD